MNTAIGVYEDHDMAIEAVIKLKENGFPIKQVSILGLTGTEMVDDSLHVIPQSNVKVGGLGTGVLVGTALGVLTGVGMFAIPGLGVLYGAGALVGALAGFDFGIIGGGIATVLATLGLKDEVSKKYQELMKAGKYIVVVHGTAEETKNAKDLLHQHAKHSELDIH